MSQLETHDVTNQPPPLVDCNLYDSDPVLREVLHRGGGGWSKEKVSAFGAALGNEHCLALGAAANRFAPELCAFDRYGHRISEVEFHGR